MNKYNYYKTMMLLGKIAERNSRGAASPLETEAANTITDLIHALKEYEDGTKDSKTIQRPAASSDVIFTSTPGWNGISATTSGASTSENRPQ